MSVVEALAREVGAVGKALHRLALAEWGAPTRCPPMTVKVLVAHMARGATRINEMLAAELLDAEPEQDSVTYWQYDVAQVSARVLRRAQEDAAARTTPELVRYWDEQWVRALQGSRALPGDPVLSVPAGPLMRLSDYLCTRVVEVTVHHMDVDDALGRDPHPDPEALEIVGDVLRGLLGTDLRPIGIDDLRFVLTGTGRARLDEKEREYLGPLAERFPLLS